MMHKYKLYKVICLIAFCIVLITPLAAQEEATTTLTYGPKISIGTSSLSVDYLRPLGQSRTIFSFGGFAQYWFSDWLGINTDLMYTQAGGSDLNSRLFYFKDDPMLGIPELNKYLERTDLLIHRIELPITGLFTLPNVPGRPIFMLGPSFGFNVKSTAINTYRWDFEDAPNDLLTVTQDNLKEKIQRADLGAVMGIAFDVKSDPINLMIGLNYRMSFTNTNNYKYSLYSNYAFNNAQIFVALKF